MIETKTPKKKQKRYIGTRVVFDYFLSNTAIFKYLGIPIEQFAANKILSVHLDTIYLTENSKKIIFLLFITVWNYSLA